MKGKDDGRIAEELAVLAKRESQIRLRMAALREQGRRLERQEEEKEVSIIGAAVVKAAAVFPELKTVIAQTALAHVTDEKQRRFLSDRGWL